MTLDFCYYEAALSGPEKDTAKRICIKTALPQNDATLLDMIHRELALAGEPERISASGIRPLPAEDAVRKYAADRMTIPVRTPYGDYFVEPDGHSAAVDLIVAGGDGSPGRCVRLSVPARTVEADCGGEAVRLLLRQISAEASGRHPSKADWTGFLGADPGLMARYGVAAHPEDAMLVLSCREGNPVMEETLFENVYHMDKALYDAVNGWIDGRLERPAQPEEISVRFLDGIRMRTSFPDPGPGRRPAVLSELLAPDGSRLAATESHAPLMCYRVIHHKGFAYRMIVMPDA